MRLPQVLSVEETRIQLSGLLRSLKQDPDEVYFMGPHRQPRAVLISVERWTALTGATEEER